MPNRSEPKDLRLQALFSTLVCSWIALAAALLHATSSNVSHTVWAATACRTTQVSSNERIVQKASRTQRLTDNGPQLRMASKLDAAGGAYCGHMETFKLCKAPEGSDTNRSIGSRC